MRASRTGRRPNERPIRRGIGPARHLQVAFGGEEAGSIRSVSLEPRPLPAAAHRSSSCLAGTAVPRVEAEPNHLDRQGRIAMAAHVTRASFTSLRRWLAACMLLATLALAAASPSYGQPAPADPSAGARARLE